MDVRKIYIKEGVFMVITIGRQYGSGGRELGKKLADQLGFDFYDEELVNLAAKKSNMNEEVLKQVDEKATRSFLYSLVTGTDIRGLNSPIYYEMPINDKLFIAQAEIIKELAQKSNCVIVGRCADYILRDTDVDCVNLFIYADMEKRIARIMRLYGLARDKAKEQIVKTEKRRKAYYNYYSNRDWGRMENYHLCIDAGEVGIDNAVELVRDYVLKKNK